MVEDFGYRPNFTKLLKHKHENFSSRFTKFQIPKKNEIWTLPLVFVIRL